MKTAAAVFRDRCSWTRINESLLGKGCNLEKTSMTELFLQFLSTYMTDELIANSRCIDKNMKVCYAIVLSGLESMVEAIKSCDLRVESIEIIRVWPVVEVKLLLL